jgi:hypothetical protein
MSKRLCNVPQGGFGLVDLNKENATLGCRGAGTTGMTACQPIAVFNPSTRRLALCHLDVWERLKIRLPVVVGWAAGGYRPGLEGVNKNTVIWLERESDLKEVLQTQFKEIAERVTIKYTKDYCSPDAGIGEDGELIYLGDMKGYVLDDEPLEWRYQQGEDEGLHKFLSVIASEPYKGYFAYMTGLYGRGYQRGDDIRSHLLVHNL